jgi:hypothetical protein
MPCRARKMAWLNNRNIWHTNTIYTMMANNTKLKTWLDRNDIRNTNSILTVITNFAKQNARFNIRYTSMIFTMIAETAKARQNIWGYKLH